VLKLPSILSIESKDLLKSLLQRNPARRLGSGSNDADEIKKHYFFGSIDWDDVYNRKLKPPLPPKRIGQHSNNPVDLGTKYKNEDYVEKRLQQNYLTGWSFMTPSEEKQN